MGSLQAVRVHRWLHRIASPTNPLGERAVGRGGYTFGKRRPFSAIYVNSLEDEESRGEEGGKGGIGAGYRRLTTSGGGGEGGSGTERPC